MSRVSRMVGPLGRAAPLRLLRQKGWFLLLACTVALLAAAIVSRPLFERSVASAATAAEIAAVPADEVGMSAAGLRTTVAGVLPGPVDAGLRTILDDLPELSSPVITSYGSWERLEPRGPVPLVRSAAGSARATLYYRDGAVEILAAGTGAPARRGVWLAEDVASSLGVRPGEEVQVVLDQPRTEQDPHATVTLAGTFPVAEGSVLPSLAPESAWVTSPRDLPPTKNLQRSAMLLADRETYDRLVLAVEEKPLWLADLQLPASPTPEQVERAAVAVQGLAAAAFVDLSDVDRLTQRVLPEREPLQVASGLQGIVDRAAATTAMAQTQVRSLAWAGLALGLAAVCCACVLAQRTRRAESLLALGLGLRPGGTARLAALEALLPSSLGATAGTIGAWVAVRGLGPSPELGDGALGVVLLAAGTTVVVAVLGAGVSAGLVTVLLERGSTAWLGLAQRRIPWELLLVTATLVAGAGLVGADTTRAPGLLAVAFPMLVAASVAALWLMLLPRVARLLPDRSPRIGSPGWLGARRSRREGGEASASVVVLAVGMAMLLWSLAADRGVERGIEDKVAAAAGAFSVADIDASWQLSPPADHQVLPRRGVAASDPSWRRLLDLPVAVRDPGTVAEPPWLLERPEGTGLPTPPLADSTFVWRQRVTLPPRFGDHDLLAVDTAFFGYSALWGSTGRLSEGRKALAGLAVAEGPLPVIAVGPSGYDVGDAGTAQADALGGVDFEVTATVEAFPGVEGVALVADAGALFDRVSGADPTVVPSDGIPLSEDGGFQSEVWSAQDPLALEEMLGSAGVEATGLRTLASVEQTPGVRGSRWPLGYLLALGGCAGLLSGAVLLLYAVRVADRDRVGELMLTRMGVTARELTWARARELALLLLRAGVAAAVAVVGLVELGPALVDPVPQLAPMIGPVMDWTDGALLVGGSLVVGAVGTVLARRRTSAVPVGEVLRGQT